MKIRKARDTDGYENVIKVKDLIKHIKDMPDNNVKSELISLCGGILKDE